MASILQELAGFRPGTRERALLYLRTGFLDVTANGPIQVRLDKWVTRIEAHGPAAREKVLAKLQEAAG